jgi:hypothetical protein
LDRNITRRDRRGFRAPGERACGRKTPRKPAPPSWYDSAAPRRAGSGPVVVSRFPSRSCVFTFAYRVPSEIDADSVVHSIHLTSAGHVAVHIMGPVSDPSHDKNICKNEAMVHACETTRGVLCSESRHSAHIDFLELIHSDLKFRKR